jgi:SulP family sulfate permease
MARSHCFRNASAPSVPPIRKNLHCFTGRVITLGAAPRMHWGVFAGIGLTMLLFFYRRSKPRILEVGQHPNGLLRDRTLFNLPSIAPDVYAVRIDAALTFFTAAALERFILT